MAEQFEMGEKFLFDEVISQSLKLNYWIIWRICFRGKATRCQHQMVGWSFRFPKNTWIEQSKVKMKL